MLLIREAERLRRMPMLDQRLIVPDEPVAASALGTFGTFGTSGNRPRFAAAAEPFPWLEAAVAAYLLGAGAVGLWLGWGAFSAGRIRRHARLASEPLHAELLRVASNGRAPRLLVSARIANAVAMGLWRPAILLPARLAETPSSESLRAVLTHEWAHVPPRRPMAVGPGPLPVAALVCPSASVVVAPRDPRRPGMAGRRRGGGRRPARLRPDAARPDPRHGRPVANSRRRGGGDLGKPLTTCPENCHALGRHVPHSPHRLARLASRRPGCSRAGGRCLFVPDAPAGALGRPSSDRCHAGETRKPTKRQEGRRRQGSRQGEGPAGEACIPPSLGDLDWQL